MKEAYAITELKRALYTAENNAPINEREGNHAQANLERNVALDIREAIAKLEAPWRALYTLEAP